MMLYSKGNVFKNLNLQQTPKIVSLNSKDRQYLCVILSIKNIFFTI